MPKTRLPGPACGTCRAKSRRCDRARPSCARCVSKDLECGGYPEKYRFCGIASRGKWKGQQEPTTQSPSSSEHAAKRRKSAHDAQEKPSGVATAVTTRSNDAPLLTDQVGTSQTQTTFSHLAIEQPWIPYMTPSDGAQVEDSPEPVGSAPESADASINMIIEPVEVTSFVSESPLEVGSAESFDDSSLTVVDDELASYQTKILLSHYESVICHHQIQQYPDDTSNPYREFILPLAYEQPELLYAVLGLSASHLGHLKSDRYLCDTVAVSYRLKALRALANAISKGISETLTVSKRDSIFATIQVLLLHDISESGISENGIHISGAVSICCQSLTEDQLPEQGARSIFFLGNLIWLDIVRAFAHPERLCFPKRIRETILSVSDRKLEMVNGCPREVMLLIGEALDQAKAISELKLYQDEYEQAIRALIRRLYCWNSARCQYPNDDPRWVSVAEAFRSACILRCLRLLDATQSAHDPEIQELVDSILDAASNIPGDCCLLDLIVLPLFMAGADCLSPHSRHYVALRLEEIEKRSEMPNLVPRNLLKSVWTERSRKLSFDRKNVPWMAFTHNPDIEQKHDYLII